MGLILLGILPVFRLRFLGLFLLGLFPVFKLRLLGLILLGLFPVFELRLILKKKQKQSLCSSGGDMKSFVRLASRLWYAAERDTTT